MDYCVKVVWEIVFICPCKLLSSKDMQLFNVFRFASTHQLLIFVLNTENESRESLIELVTWRNNSTGGIKKSTRCTWTPLYSPIQ